MIIQGSPQWSDRAIARTTPALRRPFRWLILAAHLLYGGRPPIPRRSAWYAKTHPTFADVLACVRYTLWTRGIPFVMSASGTDIPKLPQQPPPHVLDTLGYTA